MSSKKFTIAGGFKKLLRIATGWLRVWGILQTTDDIKLMSQKRLAICEKCPHAKYSKLIHIMNGNVEKIDTMVCELCKCPCLEKSVVKSEYCPINKW